MTDVGNLLTQVREELLYRGATVIHRVDACNLSSYLPVVGRRAVVIFNFPHLGDVAGDGHQAGSGSERAKEP